MAKKTKTPIMTPDQERFMAFTGAQQWAIAVVDRRDELRRLQRLWQTPADQAAMIHGFNLMAFNGYRVQSAATDVNRRARLTPVRLRRLTPVIEQIVQRGQYVAGRPAGSLLQADRGSTPAPIYNTSFNRDYSNKRKSRGEEGGLR